jgi:hypothetical protein
MKDIMTYILKYGLERRVRERWIERKRRGESRGESLLMRE